MRDAGTKSIPLHGILAAAETHLHPEEGLRVGRYTLLTPIARGGMAEVWTARFAGDLGFTRVVALKVIRPEYAEDPAFREAFFEEARIAARLRHANVVEVLELGEEGPLLFQAMALIEGDSASRLMRAHRETLPAGTAAGLPAPVALRIMLDALAGLHAAHELTDDDNLPMRLVHRDFSPHNLLVGIDGVAKLGDFGVAKFLGRRMMETDAGQIRGKPGYLAPEQLEKKPLDRRTDVFAAGIVLFELVTGRRLFRSDDARPPLADPLQGPIPDPREFASWLAPGIAEATLRALMRDPEARFESAAALAEAVEAPAREAGLLGTPRDVASLVAQLCGARLESEREAVRTALRGVPKSVVSPEPAAPVPRRPESIRDALRRVVALSERREMKERHETAVTEPGALPVVAKPSESRRPLVVTVAPRLPPEPRGLLEPRAWSRSLLAVVALVIVSAALTALVTARAMRSDDRERTAELEVEDEEGGDESARVRGSFEAAETSTVGAGGNEREPRRSTGRRGGGRAKKKRPRGANNR